MPNLSGEPGLSVGQLPVDNHSHSQSPAEIYEQHVLLIVRLSADVFPIGHRPRVVLQENRRTELFLKHLRQRLVLAEEVGEAVSGLVVHAPREVDSVGQHLLLRDAERLRVLPEQRRQIPQGLLRAFENERNVLLVIHELALEIRDRHADVMPPYVRPDEVARRLVQPVDARPPSSRSPSLSEVLQKSVVNQFADEPRDRRYARVEFLAEFRDAEISVVDAEPQNLLFHDSALALYVVEK